MPERLIDANALKITVHSTYPLYMRTEQLDRMIDSQPTIEAEPVRHGRWIECDYKTLEHGEIESAYKAGLCCSECRTGFKKNRMTHKSFCPNCGADMREGGADNG